MQSFGEILWYYKTYIIFSIFELLCPMKPKSFSLYGDGHDAEFSNLIDDSVWNS